MKAAHCVTVLCYHSIDDSGSLVSVTPARFQEQMRYIHDAGYKVVNLSDAFEGRPGSSSKRENCLVITFDDGYKNNLTEAAPILKKYNLEATVFLTTNYMEGKAEWLERDFEGVFANDSEANGSDNYTIQCREIFRKKIPYFAKLPGNEFDRFLEKFKRITELEMLTWNEARSLEEYGFSFGAHSCSHPFLTSLSDEQKQEEIVDCKFGLETNLGKRVDYFCYPYGDYSPLVEELVKSAGFLGACTTDPGVNQSNKLKPFALRRISIGSDCSMQKFKIYLSPIYRYYKYLKDAQSRYRAA